MDVGLIVGDALLASGTIGAGLLGRRAVKGARDEAAAARAVGEANHAKLSAMQDETMTERIRDAVTAYAEAHPSIVGEAVMFEAMRDLFDAVILANLDDEPTGDRRRRPSSRAARLADRRPSRRYVEFDDEREADDAD